MLTANYSLLIVLQRLLFSRYYKDYYLVDIDLTKNF